MMGRGTTKAIFNAIAIGALLFPLWDILTAILIVASG
jgi:hypothetical protein